MLLVIDLYHQKGLEQEEMAPMAVQDFSVACEAKALYTQELP